MSLNVHTSWEGGNDIVQLENCAVHHFRLTEIRSWGLKGFVTPEFSDTVKTQLYLPDFWEFNYARDRVSEHFFIKYFLLEENIS